MGSDKDFMNAAAQIIPVLVLALLADNRRQRIPIIGLTLFALYAGALGEFLSLSAVRGLELEGAANAVAICILILGSAILIPYINGRFNLIESQFQKKTNYIISAVVATVMIGLIGYFAYGFKLVSILLTAVVAIAAASNATIQVRRLNAREQNSTSPHMFARLSFGRS